MCSFKFAQESVEKALNVDPSRIKCEMRHTQKMKWKSEEFLNLFALTSSRCLRKKKTFERRKKKSNERSL